jgi:inosine-uridine nucleoside N-ribohydrolase
MKSPIPVIIDTDIGGDIDDTWALALALKSPELDVKMVLSAFGNTEYRAKIAARLLEVAGRSDVGVGVGIWQDTVTGAQEAWVRNYDLASYPGQVHMDGVDAMIRLIRESPEPVTLIGIGPASNLRVALAKAPDIVGKVNFVGMYGSIRRQLGGKEGAIPEYNVISDLPACSSVFAAPWRSATLTPLDSCGAVRLTGDRYRQVLECREPLTRAVMENYRLWAANPSWQDSGARYESASSLLFDTVAIHLACSTEFLVMERMGLRVDGQGYTRRDEDARPFAVAMGWDDLAGFEAALADRMVAPVVRPAQGAP